VPEPFDTCTVASSDSPGPPRGAISFPHQEDRELESLHPHPSYAHSDLAVSAIQLTKLEELGELAFRDPIAITSNGTVLDGYARLRLARMKSLQTLRCTVYDFNTLQALEFLLLRHRQSNSWNAFSRVLLALDLEPFLREEARLHQAIGGKRKGLANLPEADRLDVRSKIAAAADVCPRNIDKVKFVLEHAIPDVLQLLRHGEIRIHRGWTWSKLPADGQYEALWRFRSETGLKKTIRALVAAHRSKPSPTNLNVSHLIRLCSESGSKLSIPVIEVDIPGKAILNAGGVLMLTVFSRKRTSYATRVDMFGVRLWRNIGLRRSQIRKSGSGTKTRRQEAGYTLLALPRTLSPCWRNMC
jgi:hypothetical protein